MRNLAPLEVRVWSDFACFTRPEMKVERVTYPVMTPSAARGVLEAILWKPEMQWQVREIWVLKPIRHFSILRNEVKNRAVESTARSWAASGGGFYIEEERAQRHSLVLRDVAYLIRAEIVLIKAQPDGLVKYREMFTRRVEHGQCFHRPYMGCREFAASFGPPMQGEAPIDLDDDLGLILFDLDYEPGASGRGTPRFFNGRLDKGVLRIPPELYQREARNVAEGAR